MRTRGMNSHIPRRRDNLVNRFSTPIPCSFESKLYIGGKQTISEHGGYQQLSCATLAVLGVDDPVGNRLGTRRNGVGEYPKAQTLVKQSFIYWMTWVTAFMREALEIDFMRALYH